MGLQATFYDQKRRPIGFDADADWPGPELAEVYRAKTAAEFVRGVKQLIVSGKLSPGRGEHRSYKSGGAIYFINGAVRSVYDGHVEGPAADFIPEAHLAFKKDLDAYGRASAAEADSNLATLAKAAGVLLLGFVAGRASK